MSLPVCLPGPIILLGGGLFLWSHVPCRREVCLSGGLCRGGVSVRGLYAGGSPFRVPPYSEERAVRTFLFRMFTVWIHNYTQLVKLPDRAFCFSVKVLFFCTYLDILENAFTFTLWLQWRIQDFPEEAAPTPRGGTNIRFCHIFPKTVWNWKNFGQPGGGARVPLAPP